MPASPSLPADELPETPTRTPVGLGTLFIAFAKMSLAGFGGVLVWARRAIVEQHRWMTADEFNETFALCHFLPGPNIVNLSVVFGSRIRGVPGAVAACAGLLGPPVVIVTVLAFLYARYGDLEALRHTLAGVSCAAVGLLFAVIARMMLPLLKRREPLSLLVLLAVFVAVGLMRWPLPAVLLVATPVSILLTMVVQRRGRP